MPKVYDYVLYKNIKDIEIFMKVKMEYKSRIKGTSINFRLMDGIIGFLTGYSKYYKIGIFGPVWQKL
jgi:hypothetical protein